MPLSKHNYTTRMVQWAPSVQHLLSWRSTIECLIRSIVVVVVSKPFEPATCTGWTAPPKRVKAVDSHRHSLEPFFDVVPVCVVELTAQVVSKEGSQIATAINQKLRV